MKSKRKTVNKLDLLAFVRCIARMTEHKDKIYDDTENELAAFDAIIRNARLLVGE